jgi:hypothetical protein
MDAQYVKVMLSNLDMQPNAVINHWITAILLFDFKLIHIPADCHHGPDGLSQHEPIPGEDEDEDDLEEWINNILALSIWVNTWQHMQNLKTQALPTMLPFPFTSTISPPAPSLPESLPLPHKSTCITTNHPIIDAFKFSPTSSLKAQPTTASPKATPTPTTTTAIATTPSMMPALPVPPSANLTLQDAPDTTCPHPHISKCYDKLEHICSFLSNPAQLHDLQLSKHKKFIKHVQHFLLCNG